MSNLDKIFQELKAKKEGALIAYVMGGDPEPSLTPKIAKALIKGGIDILEIGIPFSDPIADGPTIQAASTRALNAETTPTMVFEIVKNIKKEYNIPTVTMTYYNLLFKMGLDKFFRTAKEHGVDGTIIPDLPLEESTDYRKAAKTNGIDTIFLAAPSTVNVRLREMATYSSGFLYLVSRFGVTGTKSIVEESTLSLIKNTLKYTAGQIPLAVGFGVSKPEHVRRIICSGADGVIVGSALVDIINANLLNQEKMLLELEETARALKQASLW